MGYTGQVTRTGDGEESKFTEEVVPTSHGQTGE